MTKGPLSDVRVVEFGSLGPVPFCAMLLADMGADVVQIARPGSGRQARYDIPNRGRRILELDMKQPAARALALRLIAQADILLEGNRPGVAERLGFGPEVCCAGNRRLVFGRMTGWGQDGPLAPTAGHDINYIALSGALHAIGPRDHPVPPLNLVGDYGGGAMYLAFGVLCALHEARRSGEGQVVDAAMVDGVSSLMSLIYGLQAKGAWDDERCSNKLDGGEPWYGVYETSDRLHVAVGALEENFWQVLLDRLAIPPASLPPRTERAGWHVIRAALAAAFKRRTRDEWSGIFAQTDACVTPVLKLSEVPSHPHIAARHSLIELNGVVQPAPAPRLSRTQGEARPSAHVAAAGVLADWGG